MTRLLFKHVVLLQITDSALYEIYITSLLKLHPASSHWLTECDQNMRHVAILRLHCSSLHLGISITKLFVLIEKYIYAISINDQYL